MRPSEWPRNARYWKRPELEGGNMNRWTPLDPYRPPMFLVFVAVGAGIVWLIWPDAGSNALWAFIGVMVGVNYSDSHFFEFRASIYMHLDDKYGPEWQKLYDTDD